MNHANYCMTTLIIIAISIIYKIIPENTITSHHTALESLNNVSQFDKISHFTFIMFTVKFDMKKCAHP